MPNLRPTRLRPALLAGLTLALLATGTLVGASVDSPHGPGQGLPAEIRATLAAADVPADAVSILVRERDGAPRLRFNADRQRNPASVMKLFTTYAALEALGPGHTWTTRLLADGPIRDGRLEGDLWLEGSGDPYLTAEDFWRMLGALRRRGVETIDGDLVFDTSRFAPPARDPGAFDDRPYRPYNQPPHPLLVNFNAIKFELEPAADDDLVRVSMHPPIGNLPVENRLKLDADAWCGSHPWHVEYQLAGQPEAPHAVLEGPFGVRCAPGHLRRTGLPVETYVHGLFSALWAQWGGLFQGDWVVATLGGEGEVLVEHDSRPLADVVRMVNKFSNNVMARHLALTIAAEDSGAPASEGDGREAVRASLAARGLDLDGLVLDEAAGLSRDNRVSATLVADLLATAADSLFATEFVGSLPISGVDGTLRNRLKDGPESGRVRMKTGMIDHVSAVAGYVRDADDEELLVVVLINHEDVHRRGRGTAIQDAVIRWAYGDGW